MGNIVRPQQRVQVHHRSADQPRRQEGLAQGHAGAVGEHAVLDAADNAGRYLELMRVDKKAEAGAIRFVLIDGPGQAVVRAAPDALVREVIGACCSAPG